jgi:hypothetical protein
MCGSSSRMRRAKTPLIRGAPGQLFGTRLLALQWGCLGPESSVPPRVTSRVMCS